MATSNFCVDNIDTTEAESSSQSRSSILNCFSIPKNQQDNNNVFLYTNPNFLDNINNDSNSNVNINGLHTPTAKEPPLSSDAAIISTPESSESTLKTPSQSPVNNLDDILCLPKGWEARTDLYGRVFYIDHVNRETTWIRPDLKITRTPIRRTPTISDRDRRNMDQRYQSMRKSIRRQPDIFKNELQIIHETPALRFITRPDLFSLLEKNKAASEMLKGNQLLKHLVSKVRRDVLAFDKLQNHRELVLFINKFADTNRALPEGWEMRTNQQEKVFFIDHKSKRTTFIDPRLPLPITTRSNVLVSRDPTLDGSENLDYEDRLIGLIRQVDIIEIIEKKVGQPVNFELRSKLNVLRLEGKEALSNFADDIELTILLSQLEEEIKNYSSTATTPSDHTSSRTKGQKCAHPPAFETKLSEFYQRLENKGYKQGTNKITLIVRRSHMMEDAFEKVMALTKKQLIKSKMAVLFEGEDGLDYGGPSREFFFLLSHELFSPYYGLFEYSADNQYTVQIAAASMSTSVSALEWFYFAGRIIGLAIVHQYLLDVFFTRPFYKQLLNLRPTLSDLESLDDQFYRSLKYIDDGSTNFNDFTSVHENSNISENVQNSFQNARDEPDGSYSNDAAGNQENDSASRAIVQETEAVDFEDLGLTFSVTEEIDGQIVEKDLKPNGSRIPVTDRNKRDYIDLMVAWRVSRHVERQMQAITRGFADVLDVKMLTKFDAQDLEFLIAGTIDLDLEDWKKNTEYRGGYHANHKVMRNFWLAVDSFDNSQRLRLLQFVTGTSSLPFDGFAGLRGSTGRKKFCLEKWGRISDLPRAHTCFNRLDLPPYTTYEILLEKLTIAINETNSYAIE